MISLKTGVGVLAAGILLYGAGDASRAADAGRVLSFNVSSACTCAQCGFEANRKLPQFEGVRKTSLSVRDRRLDVVFEERTKPVSELAAAIARLDIGRDSTLLWRLPRQADADAAAAAFGRIPGVRSAKADKKNSAVLLAFAPRPAVTLAQLDGTEKELMRAAP